MTEKSHIEKSASGTILYAEDDEYIRTSTAEILEMHGYNVIKSADGIEAVDNFIVHGDRIEILLFDILMPNKNGKDAYTEIVLMNPEIKTIFLSGYSCDLFYLNSKPAGNICFMQKPVVPSVLLGKLQDMLGR
ncbi:MAG: response regulator [Nitrospira sp.]|nr:response regulator [Nitrospira sp.]